MEDPRSFLGRELPGFAQYDTEILLAGQGTDYTNMPAESPPPSKVMEKKRSEPGRNRKQNEKKKRRRRNIQQAAKSRFIYHTHNTESYLPLLKGKQIRITPAIRNVTLVGDMFGKALEAQGVGATVDKTDIQVRLNKDGLNYARSYDESSRS